MHAVITFFIFYINSKQCSMAHDTVFPNILEIILLHQLKYRL